MMSKAELARRIAARGVYCKVRITDVYRPELGCRVPEVTGMRCDQDYRYCAMTNSGGRRYLGTMDELVREYIDL